jgi:hypothetical protein
MAPFSMKCTACGEFIYKGRKFNGKLLNRAAGTSLIHRIARKETAEEKYINIAIYRFYIRCTRCSGEIVFRTDPKNMDYVAERGAKRNFEPWRKKDDEETDMERLDRLEQEELEKDAMSELEAKTVDAKTEMAVADALDEIRSRNARNENMDKLGDLVMVREDVNEERERQEREDEEAANKAFRDANGDKLRRLTEDDMAAEEAKLASLASASSSFDVVKKKKKKKDYSAMLGIKIVKKPSLV